MYLAKRYCSESTLRRARAWKKGNEIHDGISDSEIAINDFCITRLDRNRYGGGIVFSNLHSQIVLRQPYDLEFMLLSIVHLNFSYKVHIGLFYHPPNSPPNTLDLLHTCLQDININTFSNVLLWGDFNVNVNNSSHPLFSDLCNILHSFSLVQVVPEDTHTSPSGNTFFFFFFQGTDTLSRKKQQKALKSVRYT